MQSFVPLKRDIDKRVRVEDRIFELIGLKQYHHS